MGHHILSIVWGRAGSLGRPEDFSIGPSKSWSLEHGVSACVSRVGCGWLWG